MLLSDIATIKRGNWFWIENHVPVLKINEPSILSFPNEHIEIKPTFPMPAFISFKPISTGISFFIPKEKKHCLHKDSIVIGAKGVSTSIVYIAEDLPLIVSSDAIVIKAKDPKKILPKFLYYILHTLPFQQGIERHKGRLGKNIILPAKKLRTMPFPCSTPIFAQEALIQNFAAVTALLQASIAGIKSINCAMSRWIDEN